MYVKTTNAQQIWQAPDGTRTIWEVTLKARDGREYRLKTYSRDIAALGFTGEVRSYLNPRGDRFVRQVPADKPRRTGPSRDEDAIRAQWAIGQAINLASVKMDKADITMEVIERYARELYATVSRVKGEPLTAEQQARADRYIRGLTQSAPA